MIKLIGFELAVHRIDNKNIEQVRSTLQKYDLELTQRDIDDDWVIYDKLYVDFDWLPIIVALNAIEPNCVITMFYQSKPAIPCNDIMKINKAYEQSLDEDFIDDWDNGFDGETFLDVSLIGNITVDKTVEIIKELNKTLDK